MPIPDWRVPPISNNSGPWDSDLAAQDCAATRTAAVIPHHSLDAENAFLNREEDPAYSLWASCSEPPAPRHNTNATADLSASYGTSATFGQHKTCPDRDDSNGRGLSQPPPFPSRMTSAPLSSHLNTPMSPMTRHLHTSVMTSSFSGTPLRPSLNGRDHRLLKISSNIIALNSS